VKPAAQAAVECVSSRSQNWPPLCQPTGLWTRYRTVLAPRGSRAGRAVGYLGAEFCPRPGDPPDDL